MLTTRLRTLSAVLLALLLLMAFSCGKEETAPLRQNVQQQAPDKEEAAPRQLVAEEQSRVEEGVTVTKVAEDQVFPVESIHFEFDQYVLKPDAILILDEKAAWLREHPDVNLLIEGHCDERGSNEYNLALGDRRANSAKDYLVRSGITENRLATISYGEEQPLCPQHDESCWWKNRRAHIVIR